MSEASGISQMIILGYTLVFLGLFFLVSVFIGLTTSVSRAKKIIKPAFLLFYALIIIAIFSVISADYCGQIIPCSFSKVLTTWQWWYAVVFILDITIGYICGLLFRLRQKIAI